MAAEVLGGGIGGDPDGPDDRADAESRTPLALRTRPWHVLAGRLDARLAEVVDAPVWAMDALETAETLTELYRAQARLAGMTARLLAHADRIDLPAQSGTTSTAAWLREQVRLTPRQARDAVTLGAAVESGRYPATADALAAGVLSPEQARVVVAAVDALPDRLFAEERATAEAHLVDLGRVYDAQVLARLGRHLLEVIDPELAEAELAARLEAEEDAAARATRFTLVDDGHGKAHGRFTLSSLHGRMLLTLLHAHANPQIPNPIRRGEQPEQATSTGDGGDAADVGDAGDAADVGDAEDVGDGADKGARGASGVSRPVPRPTAAVLGDALVRLIESHPVETVPTSGGLNATVVVTMSVEALTEAAETPGVLPGTGVEVTAATARRLACAAGVLPAVLGGGSRVLDLGRRARCATSAQRLALYLQQGGVCGIELCDRPASWADAHHWRKCWTDGASTDLDDLVLICPRHHTLAHKPRTTITRTDDHIYRIHHQT